MIPVLLSEGGLLDHEFHHGLFDRKRFSAPTLMLVRGMSQASR